MKTFYYNVNAPKVKKLFDLKSDSSRNLYCDNVILGFENVNYSENSKNGYLFYKQLEDVEVYIDQYGTIYSSVPYSYGSVVINNQIAFANVIVGGERKVYISDGVSSKIFSPKSPNYVNVAMVGTTACHHKGRLYVYNDGKIFGSAPLDVANSDLSSRIDFLTEEVYGKVYSLLEFGDYVYAICKWGIFRFIERSMNNVVVESVAKFNVSIIENTVAPVGQSVYFATKDAIIRLEGSNVEVVKSDIFTRGYSVENLQAIGQNGKYYVNGKFGSERLTCCFYNGRQESVCLDATFSLIPSLLVSKLPCDGIKGYWKKTILDEDLKYKSLMKFSCNVLRECVATISTKGQIKKFNLSEGKNMLNVNMTGSSFTIEIDTPIVKQKISDFEIVYYDKEM